MKRVILLIGICTIFLSFAFVKAQPSTLLLEKAVATLDTTRSASGWKAARNQFQRLAVADAGNWLPLYYQAYTDIELVFRTSDVEERSLYLQDAGRCLEKLNKMKTSSDAIRSECLTLSGYWYYAQVAVDPAGNGPKYAGLISARFAEALQSNPLNPRAMLLNASFQQRMAAFMNTSYPRYADDRQQASVLLEQETADVFPHWGRLQLAY